VAQPVWRFFGKWDSVDGKRRSCASTLSACKPAEQFPLPFSGGRSIAHPVFRDTELSDRIGFKYQTFEGEVAAEDFVQSILAFAADSSARDVLITVILDGENAWEWYQKDEDGKQFLHALYES